MPARTRRVSVCLSKIINATNSTTKANVERMLVLFRSTRCFILIPIAEFFPKDNHSQQNIQPHTHKNRPHNLIPKLQGLPDLTYVKASLFLPSRLGIAKASFALHSACRQLKNYSVYKTTPKGKGSQGEGKMIIFARTLKNTQLCLTSFLAHCSLY